MRNLRYSLWDAPRGHPQQVMKDMGITYTHSVPQSLGDQWWFLDCKDVPEELPENITEMKVDNFEDYIGYGLSEETAKKLEKIRKANKS